MNAVDLEGLTIDKIAPRIKKKEISPLELTRRYLDRIKKLNPVLNAYLAMAEEGAIAAAKKAEREISRGNYRGPLHGIPFSIKDNIATQGLTDRQPDRRSCPIGYRTSTRPLSRGSRRPVPSF
jgi:aspartyl-tRNA(Asn)/glutamyl-tRNA(Gln) amidotransferase subunit A